MFVRPCEDNGLLPEPFLSGPGDRRVLAEEAEAQFFRDHPGETLRGWLLRIRCDRSHPSGKVTA